jgi:hypothetical protein
MDKSPILPAEHDRNCQRSGPGSLDTERCERCRNLSTRLNEWRESMLSKGPADPNTPSTG